MKDQVYRTFAPKLAQLKRRISTAIRTVRQEVLNSARVNLENLSHAVIRESDGLMEHQWNSIRGSLLEPQSHTK